MNDIYRELRRLIDLNYQEQWVPTNIALQQLNQYRSQIIPGLVSALDDTDSDIRLLALSLLDEAGMQSAPGMSAMIQMLADEDRPVRVAAAQCLQKFGPMAIDAIPLLCPWLSDDHEYVRVLAAVTISSINPAMKNELLPVIKAASGSYNPLVKRPAQEFLVEH
jgi:HEAT repeat protein